MAEGKMVLLGGWTVLGLAKGLSRGGARVIRELSSCNHRRQPPSLRPRRKGKGRRVLSASCGFTVGRGDLGSQTQRLAQLREPTCGFPGMQRQGRAAWARATPTFLNAGRPVATDAPPPEAGLLSPLLMCDPPQLLMCDCRTAGKFLRRLSTF